MISADTELTNQLFYIYFLFTQQILQNSNKFMKIRKKTQEKLEKKPRKNWKKLN